MIYTFYSYKGGVGRSHLLANIAAYLCHYRGRKVLLIDWDLEAPGLHFYFDKKNEEITSNGLIDLCKHFVETLENVADSNALEEKDLLFPTIENGYITNMLTNPNGGKIDLLPATRYEKGYHTHINNFDWLDFYDKKKGNIYLGWLKDELKKRSHYDYVFIDSRTGQNDYSGICNVMMPDVNVIITAPNTQNLVGAREMADRIIESNYVKQGNRKPFILPVLSRFVINASDEEKEKWRGAFSDMFADLLPALAQDSLDNSRYTIEYEYLPATEILHGDFMGERVFFKQNTPEIKKGDTQHKISNIAKYLIEIKTSNHIEFETGSAEKYLNNNYNQNYTIYINTLKKCLRIKPDYYDAWIKLAVIYTDLRNYELATHTYMVALNVDNTKFETWNDLGTVYYRNGDFENSIKAYRKALENIDKSKDNSNFLYIIYHNLANTFYDIGNYEEAEIAYSEALKITPDNTKYWLIKNRIINCLMGQEKYNIAKLEIEELLSQKPQDKVLLNNFSHIYSLEKDRQKTLEYLERYLKVAPEDKKIYSQMPDFEWLWQDSDFQALVGE